MHKDEAARGFLALSDGNRVKIVKKLYNTGEMNYHKILDFIGVNSNNLNSLLETLIENNLVLQNDDIYSANKEYIDLLLDFIKTPCGCMRK